MATNPPSGDSSNVFSRRGLLLVGIGAAVVLALILVIRFISVKKNPTGSSVQPGQQVGTDANGNPIYAQPGGGDQFVNEVAYENLANGTQNITGSNYFGPNTDINYAPTAPNPSHPHRRRTLNTGGGGIAPPGPSPVPGPGGTPVPGPSPVPGPGGTPVPGPSPVPGPGTGGTPVPGPSPVPQPGRGGLPGPVPAPSPVPQPPSGQRPGSPRVYTVQAGDSLASIAHRFNIGGGAASLGQANDTTLKQVAVGHGISPAARSRFGAYPAAWDYVYPGEVIHLPGQPIYNGMSPQPGIGTGFGSIGSAGGVPAGGPR